MPHARTAAIVRSGRCPVTSRGESSRLRFGQSVPGCLRRVLSPPGYEDFAVKYEPIGRAGSLNLLMQRLYIYLLMHDVISVCLESEAFRLVYGGWSLGSVATAEPAAEAFALPVTSIVLRAVGETEDRAANFAARSYWLAKTGVAHIRGGR